MRKTHWTVMKTQYIQKKINNPSLFQVTEYSQGMKTT